MGSKNEGPGFDGPLHHYNGGGGGLGRIAVKQGNPFGVQPLERMAERVHDVQQRLSSGGDFEHGVIAAMTGGGDQPEAGHNLTLGINELDTRLLGREVSGIVPAVGRLLGQLVRRHPFLEKIDKLCHHVFGLVGP